LSNRSGAYHSSEIPLIFGTSADTGPDSVDEVKLARNMRHAFAEFAKDPDHGLTKLGYPDYQQESKCQKH
jgi:carboxylesterase type B